MTLGMARSLIERDWAEVERHYQDTAPFNYTVLDDLLNPMVLASVRQQLVGEWGWRYKNVQSNELYIRDPQVPEIDIIARELRFRLPHVLGGLELVRSHAFMHQRNAGLNAHSDNASVTLNIWMTPDMHNLQPETGGLILHDVKRQQGMMIHEFNAIEWAELYLKEHTQGASRQIAYRYNRAVLFDAETFHESDHVQFRGSGADTYRINLALLFDDIEKFAQRRERYS